MSTKYCLIIENKINPCNFSAFPDNEKTGNPQTILVIAKNNKGPHKSAEAPPRPTLKGRQFFKAAYRLKGMEQHIWGICVLATVQPSAYAARSWMDIASVTYR